LFALKLDRGLQRHDDRDERARRVADRIIMLSGGRFIFDGSVEELDCCAEPEVQQFVEGRATEEDLQSLHLR